MYVVSTDVGDENTVHRPIKIEPVATGKSKIQLYLHE